MPGRELIQASPEDRHVRSYHRAFNVELTIYTIGDNIRLWWAIPVRGIFWAGGFEILMLALTKILGMHAALLSPNWGALYILIPGGMAWLFAGAKPEGRRLHVTLWSWFSRTITGRQTVGGHKKLQPLNHLRRGRIKIRQTYKPREPRNWERPTLVGLGILLAAFVLLHLLNSADSGTTSAKAEQVSKNVPQTTRQLSVPARPARPARPAYPPSRGVTVPTVRHSITRHKHKHITKKWVVPKRVVSQRAIPKSVVTHNPIRLTKTQRSPRAVARYSYVPPVSHKTDMLLSHAGSAITKSRR